MSAVLRVEIYSFHKEFVLFLCRACICCLILAAGLADDVFFIFNVTSPLVNTVSLYFQHENRSTPSTDNQSTMIGTDDLEVIRTAFASFSIDPHFAAPFTDKYVTQESINTMYDRELFHLLLI